MEVSVINTDPLTASAVTLELLMFAAPIESLELLVPILLPAPVVTRMSVGVAGILASELAVIESLVTSATEFVAESMPVLSVMPPLLAISTTLGAVSVLPVPIFVVPLAVAMTFMVPPAFTVNPLEKGRTFPPRVIVPPVPVPAGSTLIVPLARLSAPVGACRSIVPPLPVPAAVTLRLAAGVGMLTPPVPLFITVIDPPAPELAALAVSMPLT